MLCVFDHVCLPFAVKLRLETHGGSKGKYDVKCRDWLATISCLFWVFRLSQVQVCVCCRHLFGLQNDERIPVYLLVEFGTYLRGLRDKE